MMFGAVELVATSHGWRLAPVVVQESRNCFGRPASSLPYTIRNATYKGAIVADHRLARGSASTPERPPLYVSPREDSRLSFDVASHVAHNYWPHGVSTDFAGHDSLLG